MSRPPRSALAALATACVLTVAGCASDQYVGSGDWTLKPEVQTPQGQAPGTPEQTPPPTTTDQQRPQWSRPPPLLSFGVRPISPHATSRILSSSPRERTSSRNALTAWSSGGAM